MAVWGDIPQSEAGRVDGGRLFQAIAFLPGELKLKYAGSGELLKDVKQGNDTYLCFREK